MSDQEVLNYLLAYNNMKLSKEKICLIFLWILFY